MEKFRNFASLVFKNFFPITIGIFIAIYLRWFQLTPLMFYNDPDGAYLVGLILLGLYSLSVIMLKRAKNRVTLGKFLLIPTIIFFLGNINHAFAFFPSIESVTKCNGNLYYITWMHPFGDYQWSFTNVTIWKGISNYNSFFFGYSGGAYKVICDQEKKEANFLDTSTDVMVFTDGKISRYYDRYAGAQLQRHFYFISYVWFRPDGCISDDWSCEVYIYTLYKCNSDYKSCEPLPIQYTSDYDGTLVLETDESANEISLYDDYDYNLDRKLIFTYGEHSRCYVEGCEILEK